MKENNKRSINMIYFSRFVNNDKGHGGVRRVSQILKIIQGYNPQFISAAEKDYINEPLNLPEILFNKLKQDDDGFKNVVTSGEYLHWSKSFRNIVFHYRFFAHKWAEVITTKLPVDIALVDDPFFFSPLVDKLKELNIPIIGFEQNIETLAGGQVEEKYRHELFKKEIECFKKCNLVVTISHEDTVVLNNFGVDTILFPYYPIGSEKELFVKIREERSAHNNKKDYIMLGTASNVPTLEGMMEMAKMWSKAKQLKNVTLYIVGYGTEGIGELLGTAISENVKILGGIDDSALHALLKKIKASIVFQSSGTGTLTRIMEMLIAGVPVYANYHAARSFHNVKGVVEYNSFADLINLLTTDDTVEHIIDIPIPEPPQNDFLLRQIDNIVTGDMGKRDKNDYRTIIQKQAGRIIDLEKDIAKLSQEMEDSRATQMERIKKLVTDLGESEADRAARLEQIIELTHLLKESEADRAARLKQINELTHLLKESEANRAARLEVIHKLEENLSSKKKAWSDLENTFAVRLARRIGFIKTKISHNG